MAHLSLHSLVSLLLLVAVLATGSCSAKSTPPQLPSFTWIEDPHAADPCTSEPGCFNNVKSGYNVVPVNVTGDAKIVMQTAERPSNLAAVLNLEIYTQPGCLLSGCSPSSSLFGLINSETCFKQMVEKTANQPDGITARIDFGGMYYPDLPAGELYVKFEAKNYLTMKRTCTYEVRSGYKRWL